jgi:putative intracellular protease/amidase
MKRRIVLFTVAFAVVSMFGSFAAAEQVLMIVKENSGDMELMLNKEVGVMKEMLEEAGFDVVVATASGQRLAAGTASLEPDLKLADVKAADYEGVIVPCMGSGASTPAPEAPQAAAIVKEIVAAGKPAAAQLASVLILGEAGVMSGKKYASTEEAVKEKPVLADAVYSGTGVVQDGKIITSGACPLIEKNQGFKDGTEELTRALIAELK